MIYELVFIFSQFFRFLTKLKNKLKYILNQIR